ncbi:MAG TPA: dTDP-4-dehydrorhamnose 3,5-epimerase [Gemmatimonadales bacterium]|nr:dTDP-4-dehydrorhamnose 3,5-epimerase [Gemmatimonadales bacterium]
MKVESTRLPGVLVIEPVVHRDRRGFFLETWRAERLWLSCTKSVGRPASAYRSARGTLRGLHYQVDQVQGKLVRCATGEIFDVAVDLRRGSPTYGGWASVTLSDRDHRQLWIPPGCAHGFYVLSDVADVEYKCTAPYAPAAERVIRWDDPDLAIAWPLEGGVPVVSPKDAGGLAFRDAPACG